MFFFGSLGRALYVPKRDGIFTGEDRFGLGTWLDKMENGETLDGVLQGEKAKVAAIESRA